MIRWLFNELGLSGTLKQCFSNHTMQFFLMLRPFFLCAVSCRDLPRLGSFFLSVKRLPTCAYRHHLVRSASPP